jgi:hypothetical protein
MTTPPGRYRPSLLGTLLRVVAALVGIILVARLVPLAIRAIGGASALRRGGFSACCWRRPSVPCWSYWSGADL